MRHKQLLLSALLLLALGLSSIQAQTMYVKQNNGSKTAYALGSLRKMSFSSGKLTVTKKDNSKGIYNLNDLIYLNFSDISTDLNEKYSVKGETITAYPNPVSDILNIDLSGTAMAEGTINIISIEGRILVTHLVTDGTLISLDISQLTKGIYICHYSNQAESTTVKIIKQ